MKEIARTRQPTWRAIFHSLVKFVACRVGQRNIDQPVDKGDLCIVQDQQVFTAIDILLVPTAKWTRRQAKNALIRINCSNLKRLTEVAFSSNHNEELMCIETKRARNV
jgi:hypothetical protein